MAAVKLEFKNSHSNALSELIAAVLESTDIDNSSMMSLLIQTNRKDITKPDVSMKCVSDGLPYCDHL